MTNYWSGNKIVLCILAVMLFAGCGLKANPLPVESNVNRVQNEQTLAAVQNDGAIELTWPAPKGNYSHVKVEKSELGITGNICKDCPQTYTKIAEVTLKSESRYVDKSVEKGKSYSYRLNLCDVNAVCHPSQTVQVDVK